jgi:serine/threonine-protein kinase
MSGEQDLCGAVLGGRYRVERRLAGGGMGVVYAATDTRLDRKIALKVVHAHLAHDARILERFRREASAAGGLEHPHIVQVTDFVEAQGAPPFLVMELLQGEPLSEVLRRERTLEPGRMAFIAWQTLDALGAAHAAGIVHRDLKPANIFLTTVAGVLDVVKVLDFGVAKLSDSNVKLTQAGDVIGTPAFMAPEQLRGEEIDGRADLYALGVVMYGCLAGTPPFWSPDPAETVRRVVAGTYEPLVARVPGLEPALAAVVEKAFAARREARFGSAGELRAALAPFVETEGAGRNSSRPPVRTSDHPAAAALETRVGLDATVPAGVAAHDPAVPVAAGRASLPSAAPASPQGLRVGVPVLVFGGLAVLVAGLLLVVAAWFLGRESAPDAAPPPALPSLGEAQRRFLGGADGGAALRVLFQSAPDAGGAPLAPGASLAPLAPTGPLVPAKDTPPGDAAPD